MTQQLKLSLNRPLVGLRARSTAASGPVSPGDSSEWIFRMRDHLRREVERREAFQTCLEGIDRAVDSIASTVNGRLDDVAALDSCTSTRCPSKLRLRILRPMIVLYRKTVFSTRLRVL